MGSDPYISRSDAAMARSLDNQIPNTAGAWVVWRDTDGELGVARYADVVAQPNSRTSVVAAFTTRRAAVEAVAEARDLPGCA